MVRSPIVAGKFYEGDFEQLEKEITGLFAAKLGPGELPITRNESRKIKGIIVPHAGYVYSGSCALWAYKEIAESHFPKTYVLLGFSHMGEQSGISIEDWKTPFGMVKTDKDLAIELKENTCLDINEDAHMNEHSIEVQLPLLQFASKDRMKDIRIVAISVNRDVDFRQLGEEMEKVLSKKDVVFIVSSDFTHYGRSYGYLPFTSDIKERLNNLDRKGIDFITKLDIPGFSDYINTTQVTICGYYPILLLMKLFSDEEVKPKGSLLMHYTSSDLTEDYSSSVSYVSILFK
ncbi:MAG: AmmeMemoRadiSam system protein B [Nanoarchaeota archaeon]|nr:AmmeMemoRadiSam system protein B [Nanoarchaeota archaeon]